MAAPHQPDQRQPRPGRKDKKLSVRITTAGHDRIADRARREDVTPGHMVRRMLAFANQHMPEFWVPGVRAAAPPAGQQPNRQQQTGRARSASV